MIQLTGLTKSYHRQPVLNGVSLSIATGDIFGIIGRSGAGKSTLLRCMNLLTRPDSGAVWINKQNLMQLSPADLRKARHNVGMIFQHFNLLESKNVYDNVALPMRIQRIGGTQIHTKVTELLELVELSDKHHAFPRELSGGEKQRVAIARALSSSPQVLLCDEATSALDPETTHSILDLIKKINSIYNVTVVLITHEMDVIKRICHQVAVMDAGQLVEITPLADVFTREHSIAKRLLYAQLSPKLPMYLVQSLTQVPNNRPLLRLFFAGESASGPFISQASRILHVDISILLATIDSIESITCGIVIIELRADSVLLDAFLAYCQQHRLTVEILGYVTLT